MSRTKPPYNPVTLGDLRRDAKWLHLYCTKCGREREVEPTRPPFGSMPDSTIVHLLGKAMVCTACGTKGKVWSVPEFHAAPERRAQWRRS